MPAKVALQMCDAATNASASSLAWLVPQGAECTPPVLMYELQSEAC